MGVRVGWFRTIKEVGWNTTPLEKVMVAKMVIPVSLIVTPDGLVTVEDSIAAPVAIGGSITRTDYTKRIIITLNYGQPGTPQTEAVNGTRLIELYLDDGEYDGEDLYYSGFPQTLIGQPFEESELEHDEDIVLTNGFGNGSSHGSNDPYSVTDTPFKLADHYPWLLYTTTTTETLTAKLAQFDAEVSAGRSTFLAAGVTEPDLNDYDSLSAAYRANLIAAVDGYLTVVQSLYNTADHNDLDSFNQAAFNAEAATLQSADPDYSALAFEIATLNSAAGL